MAAGLQVLVLSLPLAPGAEKEDLDGFLLRRGPAALCSLLHTTPVPLHNYAAHLPRDLLLSASFDLHKCR